MGYLAIINVAILRRLLRLDGRKRNVYRVADFLGSKTFPYVPTPPHPTVLTFQFRLMPPVCI